MALSDSRKADIRDEEILRDQVRKDLAGPKPPSTWLGQIGAFLETKAGFWLLTTVIAGLFATGFAELQKYLNQDELNRKHRAEQSQRDVETLLKLGPLLSSKEGAQRDMAIVMLESLISRGGVDQDVGKSVSKIVTNSINAGLDPMATDDQRALANALVAYGDKPRVAEIQERPTTEVKSGLAAAIDAAPLPARVYLQIARESDRESAKSLSASLGKAGLIVPGIELVNPRNADAENDLRYCSDKVAPGALERVKAAVRAQMDPPPTVSPLPAKLCGNVRFNHFEIWFGTRPK